MGGGEGGVAAQKWVVANMGGKVKPRKKKSGEFPIGSLKTKKFDICNSEEEANNDVKDGLSESYRGKKGQEPFKLISREKRDKTTKKRKRNDIELSSRGLWEIIAIRVTFDLRKTKETRNKTKQIKKNTQQPNPKKNRK